MNAAQEFRLSGVALPKDAAHMLEEICEHFVEHAEVRRTGDIALLTSQYGTASIRIEAPRMLIELSCASEQALQMTRTSIAEHMFYFAGEDPLELTWARPTERSVVPNIHEAVVVSREEITPHMLRVKFACDDISPFVGGDMHVRLLVPPVGRSPVWPSYREDGRVAWPEGEDELLVRVYTVRAVDAERRELSVDFLQHPAPGVATPGADFARDARPGRKVAFLGPGGGGLPVARSVLMIGDESALPAIARIAAEAPSHTKIHAIIEVEDRMEEQPLTSPGALEIRWLHRKNYPAGTSDTLLTEARKAIEASASDDFIWAACEKEDIRAIRSLLKLRKHDRKKMYVAWYWER